MHYALKKILTAVAVVTSFLKVASGAMADSCAHNFGAGTGVDYGNWITGTDYTCSKCGKVRHTLDTNCTYTDKILHKLNADGTTSEVSETTEKPKTTPYLIWYKPEASKDNHKAFVYFPGGGYNNVDVLNGGDQYGRTFAAKGYTVVVCWYRGYNPKDDSPFKDANAAMLAVRAYAKTLGITEVGVAGDSAGGHLASYQHVHGTGNAKSDFAILAFPCITCGESTSYGFSGNIGATTVEKQRGYCNDLFVTAATGRAFIYVATSDAIVPCVNSYRFADALKAKGVPYKLHIYQAPAFSGNDHGFKISDADKKDNLSTLIDSWLKATPTTVDERTDYPGTIAVDAARNTYAWKGAAGAKWNAAESWTPSETGSVKGYPADMVYPIAAFSGDATVDLDGKEQYAVQFSLAAGKVLTVKNGTLKCVYHPSYAGANTLRIQNATVERPFYTTEPDKGFGRNGSDSTLVLENGSLIGSFYHEGNGTMRLDATGTCSLQDFNDIGASAGATLAVRDGSLAIIGKGPYSNGGLNHNGGGLTVALSNATVTAANVKHNGGTVRFEIRLGANNTTATSVFKSAGADNLTKLTSLVFDIDATDVTTAGTYPIYAATGLTLPGAFDPAGATVRCASGMSGALAKSGNALNLVLTGTPSGPVTPSPTEVAKPTLSAAKATYSGQVQKPTVAANAAYTVDFGTGDYTSAGAYTVTVSLVDKTATCWQGGGTDDLVLSYEIKKAPLKAAAENQTVTEGNPAPTFSVTVTGFVNGETAATAAGYAAPTASCPYTPASAAGTYDIGVSGGSADNYEFTEYAKGALTVNAKGGDEPQSGDPDTQAVTYTWTGNGGDGKWANRANWSASVTPCFGYPDNETYAKAVFNGDATVDLEGATFATCGTDGKGVTIAAGAKVTIRNGRLKWNNTSDKGMGVGQNALVTLEDVQLECNRYGWEKFHTLVLRGTSSLSGTYRAWNTSAALEIRDGATSIGYLDGYSSNDASSSILVSNATLTVGATGNLAQGRPYLLQRGGKMVVNGTSGTTSIGSTTGFSFEGGAFEAPGGLAVNFSGAKTFAVKAAAYGMTAGEHALITTKGTLTLPDLVDKLDVTGLPEGVTAELVPSDRTLKLVLTEASVPTAFAKPSLSAAKATYSGQVQKPTVVANSAYTVDYGEGDYKGAGTYSVTVSLVDKTATCWQGGGTDDLMLSYEIKKAPLKAAAENQTVTEGDPAPTLAVTVTGFVNGETAATAAGYAAPTASCPYTSASAAGTYDIGVSGGSADNYEFTEYTKGTLTVKAKGGDEPQSGDPDTQAVTYTWTGNGGDGKWANRANWSASETPCFGYPDNETYAKAVFNGDATVDLCGEEIETAGANGQGVTVATVAKVTIKNGKLKWNQSSGGTGTAVGQNATVTLEDVTLTCAYYSSSYPNALVFRGTSSLSGSYRPWGKSSVLEVRDGATTIGKLEGYGGTYADSRILVSNATLTVGATSNLTQGRPYLLQRGGKLVVNGTSGTTSIGSTTGFSFEGGAFEAPGGLAVNFSGAKTFAVKAADYGTSAGEFVLIATKGALTLPDLAGKLDVTGLPDGVTAELVQNGNVLKLVMTSGEVHEHVWGEWTTNVPPTCVTGGERTRSCTAEGCTVPPATETETLDALGHDYVNGKCQRCGADEPLTQAWTHFGLAATDFEPMPADENVAFGCTATNEKMTDGKLNSKSSYQSNWASGSAPVVTFGEATDISEIRFYSSWDTGRDGFGIKEVNVRYDGEASFTKVESIPEFPYTDENKGNMCAAIRAPDGQTLAKNVIAVQIVLGDCDNSWIGIGEIEVRKFAGSAPSVPTLKPSQGKLTAVVKATDAEAAKSLIAFVPPEGVEVSADDYAKCFALTATDAGDGNWTVTAELNEDVVRPTLVSGEEGSPAFEVGDEVRMLVGNVRPGLYYGYVTASELAGLAEAQPVLQSDPAANSDPLTLRIENPGTPSAFYRAVVSEVPLQVH